MSNKTIRNIKRVQERNEWRADRKRIKNIILTTQPMNRLMLPEDFDGDVLCDNKIVSEVENNEKHKTPMNFPRPIAVTYSPPRPGFVEGPMPLPSPLRHAEVKPMFGLPKRIDTVEQIKIDVITTIKLINDKAIVEEKERESGDEFISVEIIDDNYYFKVPFHKYYIRSLVITVLDICKELEPYNTSGLTAEFIYNELWKNRVDI